MSNIAKLRKKDNVEGTMQLILHMVHNLSKVIPYSITSIWLAADPGFLAVTNNNLVTRL